jgi:hypothetical protein
LPLRNAEQTPLEENTHPAVVLSRLSLIGIRQI